MTSMLTDLLLESRQRGFLGPGPVETHLDHARAFAVAAGDAPARAIDLGAGGGLPGLVLAAEVWPETEWVFLDAQQKRTAFLTEAAEDLGLEARVQIITDRAEALGRDLAHREQFDLVVARSFGAPAIVIECAAPLLAPGGVLVVSEPPAADAAARWPAAVLADLGCAPAEPVVVGDDPEVHLVRIVRVGACPERYPRRVGIPAKRPLF